MERGAKTLHVAEREDAGVNPRAPWGNPISPMSPPESEPNDEAVERSRIYDVDLEGRPIAEFGNERIMKIPHNAINILPQIRTEFDYEKLEELADSMPLAGDVDGLIHELMEPLIVGLHDRESAERYLVQYNLAHDTSYDVNGLMPYVINGVEYFVIHIGGERRYRAAEILINRHGYSPESVMMCGVHENITYVDALPKQFIENNARVNPPPQDEARAIRQYIEMMRVIEPKYTQADCAKKFAVYADKVHDAIVFTDYPKSMQELAKYYPYSWVINVEEIFKTWVEYYQKNASGLINPEEMGLFAPDESVVEGVSDNGNTTWTASDGAMYYSSPEDVATHEVETCFKKIKMNQLSKRVAQDGAKGSNVSVRLKLNKELEEIKRLMKDEADDIGQPELDAIDTGSDYDVRWTPRYDSDESNDLKQARLRLIDTYVKRRKIAASGLFEASLKVLWLLQVRGDLSLSMRKRVKPYSTVEADLGALADIFQDSESELLPAG